MKLLVVGLGCGSSDLLTESARSALMAADVVYVKENYRKTVAFHPGVALMGDLNNALDEIESALKTRNVAIGVSGDPGLFSFLGLLERRFSALPDLDLRVIPGIGSLNYFFAKLRTLWNGAAILSGHGRAMDEKKLATTISRNEKTVLFCDRTRNPNWICTVLARYEREFHDETSPPLRVAVGENLSLENERVSRGTAAQLAASGVEFSPHALVAVFNDAPTPLSTARPRDEEFIRTEIPMTRQEIRSAILDELRPAPDSVVWDIGAGSGSVAVACALLCPEGEVHAVERLPEAAELIRQNRRKFRACNLEIHTGSAPQALSGLPCPTHVFIGGSGGNLEDILGHLTKLDGAIRVCVSAVTLETLADASHTLMNSQKFTDLDVVQLAVARTRALGASRLLSAQNPVALWTATTVNGRRQSDER